MIGSGVVTDLLVRFAAAEEDCSLSLSLDQTYLKAWLRRATAREKLGKLAEAKQGEKRTS